MVKRFCCFLGLLFTVVGVAQEMQEGFTYLETGKYAAAVTFFENVLQKYPTNKTAKLCYGRAVGLSGDATQALHIFTELRTAYPDDFEIKLNYAEALLWDHQYSTAVANYKKLVAIDTTSFSATLGYANSLSNVQQYQEAEQMIQKALAITPKNPNALVSQKYIRLGYANQLFQKQSYTEAIAVLSPNLIDFPKDKDTQLLMATIYMSAKQLSKAKEVYESLAVTPKDSIIALQGLALVAHKAHREKQALALAMQAKDRVQAHQRDTTLYITTHERYIQALLWNRKFKTAASLIEELQTQFPEHTTVRTAMATHGMYTSNFDKSIAHYKKMLSVDSTSFDGNLGIANAYRAKGHDIKAYTYAFKTLRFYPRQVDAAGLIHTLKRGHSPFIKQHTAFTFDNADNHAITTQVAVSAPLSTRWTTSLSYTNRQTDNAITMRTASADAITLGTAYKFNNTIKLSANAGVNATNGITTDYTQWTANVQMAIRPYKLQNLSIAYRRLLQDFNADLMDREIVMNDYMLTYALSTHVNLGWYTQYIYTTQSDSNTRNLLFTSLYYSSLQRPMTKAGINYQYITFQEQVPTIYFSPEQFHLLEAFIGVTSKQEKRWSYAANVAAGLQFIEQDAGATTFRAEAKIAYRITDRFKATAYGKYSTIASATATGFRFTEIGWKLQWYFLRAPIFNKKILRLERENALNAVKK